jgi:hypothetical protein
MVKWIKGKFGEGAVPWFFLCAPIVLGVAGIAGTIFFAVTGIVAGLWVSVPAIVVGLVGVPVTGMILEDKNYV